MTTPAAHAAKPNLNEAGVDMGVPSAWRWASTSAQLLNWGRS